MALRLGLCGARHMQSRWLSATSNSISKLRLIKISQKLDAIKWDENPIPVKFINESITTLATNGFIDTAIFTLEEAERRKGGSIVTTKTYELLIEHLVQDKDIVTARYLYRRANKPDNLELGTLRELLDISIQ
mmetsp:Transcript_5550/g.16555  ORF Transcript_5550/g.16555 Transcript_5550/m.16555 type:complete len:133 (-) Transcript_5550:147-545(-)